MSPFVRLFFFTRRVGATGRALGRLVPRLVALALVVFVAVAIGEVVVGVIVGVVAAVTLIWLLGEFAADTRRRRARLTSQYRAHRRNRRPHRRREVRP